VSAFFDFDPHVMVARVLTWVALAISVALVAGLVVAIADRD
jgi:hypothetical protein